MAFGETEAAGLVLVVAVAVLASLTVYALVRSHRLARQAASARDAVLDLEERARVGVLRHKGFDEWFEADKKRRERVGLPPLDREEARARRFDPTYKLNVPAPRHRDLRKVRGAVKEAVDRGEEPAAATDDLA